MQRFIMSTDPVSAICKRGYLDILIRLHTIHHFHYRHHFQRVQHLEPMAATFRKVLFFLWKKKTLDVINDTGVAICQGIPASISEQSTPVRRLLSERRHIQP